MTTLEKREIAPDTIAHIQQSGEHIYVAIIRTYYWGLHDEPEAFVVQAQAFKTISGVENYIHRYVQLSGVEAA